MPIYEYECPDGHRTERIRKFADRDDETICRCGVSAGRVVSVPHAMPDGMYSYAPNIGSESAFARRIDAMREGVKVMPKSET